ELVEKGSTRLQVGSGLSGLRLHLGDNRPDPLKTGYPGQRELGLFGQVHDRLVDRLALVLVGFLEPLGTLLDLVKLLLERLEAPLEQLPGEFLRGVRVVGDFIRVSITSFMVVMASRRMMCGVSPQPTMTRVRQNRPKR